VCIRLFLILIQLRTLKAFIPVLCVIISTTLETLPNARLGEKIYNPVYASTRFHIASFNWLNGVCSQKKIPKLPYIIAHRQHHHHQKLLMFWYIPPK